MCYFKFIPKMGAHKKCWTILWYYIVQLNIVVCGAVGYYLLQIKYHYVSFWIAISMNGLNSAYYYIDNMDLTTEMLQLKGENNVWSSRSWCWAIIVSQSVTVSRNIVFYFYQSDIIYYVKLSHKYFSKYLFY